MKKLLLILTLLSVFAVSVFAAEQDTKTNNEKDESKWTTLSYVNVPILKIMEGKDGYAVIYQKNRHGVGSTVIPKSWAKGNAKNPRKLKFRNSKLNNTSYMTVVKDGDEFKRVILTIPMNKSNPVWGVIDYRKTMEGTDKDSLEELEL